MGNELDTAKLSPLRRIALGLPENPPPAVVQEPRPESPLRQKARVGVPPLVDTAATDDEEDDTSRLNPLRRAARGLPPLTQPESAPQRPPSPLVQLRDQEANNPVDSSE